MAKTIFDLATKNKINPLNKQDGDETLKQTQAVITALISPLPQQVKNDEKQGLQELNIANLVPFHNHPFKPYQDELLKEMVESIKENGIITPIVARPIHDEKYEIISGHNRVNAAKLAGLSTVPCIIKDIDDATAELEMIETNLRQRTKLLPSEKAFAFKMRMEALKKQGKRSDILSEKWLEQTSESTLCQFGTKLNSAEEIAENSDENTRNIFRYLRLTFLISNLLECIDNNELSLLAGVELSYLSEQEQNEVYEYFFLDKKGRLDLKMSQAIRELSKKLEVTYKAIDRLVNGKPAKPKKLTAVSVKYAKIKDYLPDNVTRQQAEKIIIEALEFYKANKTDSN